MCPLTKGVGGAHLKRARVASIPAPHPGYSLLGFRVLPPNPPSKEGFLPPNPPSKGGFSQRGAGSVRLDPRSAKGYRCADLTIALLHPLVLRDAPGVPLRGFDDCVAASCRICNGSCRNISSVILVYYSLVMCQ